MSEPLFGIPVNERANALARLMVLQPVTQSKDLRVRTSVKWDPGIVFCIKPFDARQKRMNYDIRSEV